MDIVHPRVVGIQVHKKLIWVAVAAAGRGAGRADRDGAEVRYVLAVAAEDGGLAGGAGMGVTDAAMGRVYWWPAYDALGAAGIEASVCNATHMRKVPRGKTDLLTELI